LADGHYPRAVGYDVQYEKVLVRERRQSFRIECRIPADLLEALPLVVSAEVVLAEGLALSAIHLCFYRVTMKNMLQIDEGVKVMVVPFIL
jgi:hypothetical protein